MRILTAAGLMVHTQNMAYESHSKYDPTIMITSGPEANAKEDITPPEDLCNQGKKRKRNTVKEKLPAKKIKKCRYSADHETQVQKSVGKKSQRENVKRKTMAKVAKKKSEDEKKQKITDDQSSKSKSKKTEAKSKPEEKKEKSTNVDTKYRTISSRVSPHALFSAIHSMNSIQKNCITKMGFGKLIGMKTDGIPAKIAYYVVKAFNPNKMVIECKNGDIPVTRDAVHEAFGLPLGKVRIETLPFKEEKDWYDSWTSQFAKSVSTIYPSDLVNAIIARPRADIIFKANFILLLCSTLGMTNKMGVCSCRVMSYITRSTRFSDLDWCSYILSFVRSTRESWDETNSNSKFLGPAALLTLLYVDYIKCKDMFVERGRPIINCWTFDLLRFRENKEIELGGFGLGEMRGPYKEISEQEFEEDNDNSDEDDHEMDPENDSMHNNIVNEKDDNGFNSPNRSPSESDKEETAKRNENPKDTNKDGLKSPETSNDEKNKSNDVNLCDFSPEMDVANQPAEDEDGFDTPVNIGKHIENEPEFELSLMWLDEDFVEAEIRSCDDASKKKVVDTSGKEEYTSDAIFQKDKDNGNSGIKDNTGKETNGPGKGIVSVLNPTPLKVIADLNMSLPNEDRPKRVRKTPAMFKSPYIIMETKISIPTRDEASVPNWVFSLFAGISDEIFKATSGQVGHGGHFCCMAPHGKLYSTTIDCFVEYLNFMEIYRADDSRKRYYFKTNVCSTDFMDETDLDDQVCQKLFLQNVESCLRCPLGVLSITDFDLIFFPVVKSGHIFCYCFDMRNRSMCILDNMNYDKANFKKYNFVTCKLQRYFAEYLMSLKHKDGERFMCNVEATRVEMRWRTKYNIYDCGIFTMRHMETFPGNKGRGWNCGLDVEGGNQKIQLKYLRYKYCYKMLTSDVDLFNHLVKENVHFYKKIPALERQKTYEDAMVVMQERLKKWE